VGVGFGLGHGVFRNVSGTIFYKYYGSTSSYDLGVTPEIQFGRMLGEHYQVGLTYEAWMTEFGDVNVGLPAQWRRSMQNFAVSFAVFPGNQHGASCGIFLRAGVGLGWTGTGVKEVIQGQAQGEGARKDDYGWSAFGEGGYEFWIRQNASVGLSVTFNYMDVSGDYYVNKAGFASIVTNFNVYW
jgi:hypothetical protein